MRKFNIASVNMRRRNAAMHALLNSNKTDDILFIQEPWFNRIGIARSDAHREGVDVLGGAANPSWNLSYPSFTSEQRAKVMTYTRIHDRDHPFKKNFCRTNTRNDLAAHPCIIISDIIVGHVKWRAINFYNDTADASALATLLSLDLDSTIPTILVGDFNIHSPSWSAADWSQSSSAPKLEEWLATQTFTMLTQPTVPTRRGENGARDSTIDLIWVNFAVSIQNSFQGTQIDWEGSLGSDHALIRTVASTPMHIQRNREDRTNRFNTDISPKEWEEWGHIFSQTVPVEVKPTSTQHIDQLIDAIYLAYNTA
ncbi:Endonuclease/exonuclease/phosphatase, partial [Lactarius tabidus]